jgi:hypothetical protein
MKKCSYIIYLFLLLASAAYSYPFVVPYFDEEFFLYPFLNYDQNIEWKRSREGKLYDGGFVQTSHGSLTTWMLLRSEEAVINTDIGEEFTFRFRYRTHYNRHLSYDEQTASAGLGYRINPNFSLTAETELSSEKSEIDLKPGILFTFQTVYAHIGLSFDEFMFDKKNVGDGLNRTVPVTFTSDIKFDFSRLYFFISGKYGTGSDRKWNAGPYAEVLEHKNHIRNLYARIEYDLTDNIRLYQESYFDDFYDAKRLKPIATWDSIPPDTTLNTPARWGWVNHEQDISEYDFKAKIFNIRFGVIWALNEKNSLEPGISYARTKHEFELVDGQALDNGHAKSYTIDYRAVLPYIIYKYRIHTKFTAEASYMGCYTVNEGENNLYYLKRGENYTGTKIF